MHSLCEAFYSEVNLVCFCMFNDVVAASCFPDVVVYNSERQLFVLNFRGLSFEFHIESKFEVSRLRNRHL